MKTVSVVILALCLAGCVTGPNSESYGGGYYPPPPTLTKTYTDPQPSRFANKVCHWQDYYDHLHRVWVREEHCHWR
jgi:hypothetical protein